MELKSIITGSDVGSIAIGTDYNNYVEISNGYGDGENLIEFVNSNPYDTATFITCCKSDGNLKLFYYDCPNEKTEYEVLEKGRYGIYLDKETYAKFYFVKWD